MTTPINRRRGAVGSYPNEAPRSHAGKYGLRERYELPLNFVANPRDYLVSRFGTPSFVWVAGDGNTPTVGPALTATGTPGSLAGPWELEDGTRLPLEMATGTSCRTSATKIAPANAGGVTTEDVVIPLIGVIPSANADIYRYISTRTIAGLQGFEISLATAAAPALYAVAATSGGSAVSQPAASHIARGGLFVAVLIYNCTANTVVLWTPGGVGAAGAVPAGTVTGGGLGVSAMPDGSLKLSAGAGVLATAFYKGAGLAAAWAADTYARCKELTALATGLEPRGNQAPSKGRPTCARASAVTWYDDDGRLWIGSAGLMRAGDPKGCRIAPARTNLCYNNVNPQNTTGLTASGGTLARVADDSAALATAKLECLGPSVFSFAPGASDQSVRCGANTGAVTKHSESVFLRGAVGGESVHLGLWDASAGAFTAHATVTLTTGWQRFNIDNITPGDTDCSWAIEGHAGDTFYFVGQQLELGEDSTSLIPNWATAATAARAATTLDPPVTPRDARGKVKCGVTPLGYSGAVTGGNTIVARTTGGTVLGTDDSTDDWTTNDGSTEVKAGAVATGTRAAIVVEWAGTTQQLTVDGTAASAAYDGAVAGSGTYRLQASSAEVAIDSLVIEEAS